MGSATRAEASSARSFTLWGMALWAILLLAALGFVQYLQHGEYASLIAACVVIVVGSGCLLRQAWARSCMRVLAVLLGLWALATAVLMLQQSDAFDHARQQVSAQAQFSDLSLWLINRAQRTWQIGLGLKVVAVPLLFWLAWQLGRAQVRAQFHPLRRATQGDHPGH